MGLKIHCNELLIWGNIRSLCSVTPTSLPPPPPHHSFTSSLLSSFRSLHHTLFIIHHHISCATLTSLSIPTSHRSLHSHFIIISFIVSFTLSITLSITLLLIIHHTFFITNTLASMHTFNLINNEQI